MNSLEEWPTFTIEQVNELINQAVTNVLENVIKITQAKRGYLNVDDEIRKAFNFYPVEPKVDKKDIKSLLRIVK